MALPIAAPALQKPLATTAPKPVAAAPVKVEFPIPTFSGELKPSIVPDDLTHVVFVTGWRGQGKTSFCLGLERPENVAMLDYESKGEGLATPAGVGAYFSILDDCAEAMGQNFKPIHIYERTRQIINEMPKDRFTVLVLDNAGHLQDGVIEEVKRDPLRYGVDPDKARTGQYGGAIPGAKFVLKSLFSLARAKGIKVIAVTFQLSKAWGNGQPLFNKFKTTDVTIWHELSVLSLVMVPGLPRYLPAPSAIVMKEQLASVRWDEAAQRMRIQRRLPFKLPIAEAAEVYNYLKNPVDFKNLKEGEMPEPGEIDPYLPSFSREQLKDLERLARAAEAFKGEEASGSEDTTETLTTN